MADFDLAGQKEALAIEAARGPRVSIVRVDGERTVSAGLEAAESALEKAKESEADRIILEIAVYHEANLRDA